MASGARAERDRVEAVITACVERLGYQEIKEEQKEAIVKFVFEGRDVLFVYRLGLVNPCATTAYRLFMICCEQKKGAVRGR